MGIVVRRRVTKAREPDALGCGAVRACKNPSYFKAQEVTKHTEDVPHSLAVTNFNFLQNAAKWSNRANREREEPYFPSIRPSSSLYTLQ
jgi:hypothetical protein